MVAECKISNKGDIKIHVDLYLGYGELKIITEKLKETTYHGITNNFLNILEGVSDKIEKEIIVKIEDS